MRPAYGKGTVSLLSKETQQRLQIDCSSLAPGSHTLVLVRCNNCAEEFLREFRHLDHLHACPAITSWAGDEVRWCGSCQRYLTAQNFDANESRVDNRDAVCALCLEKHKAEGRIYLQMLLNGLNGHGPLEVDLNHLMAVYEQQRGLCFYSKIRLEFGTSSLRCAGIDRLDKHQAYVPGNVILVSGAGRIMRAGDSDLAGVLLDLVGAQSSHIRLESKVTHPLGRLPHRKRTYDAGYDIASISEVEIQPHTTENIDTGLIISPPEGFYYSIEGRSSLWKKGIVPCRGIIDSSYTGDLMVAIQNHSNEPYVIRSGDRIAQLVLHKIHHADFVEVEEFSPVEFGRSNAGFGSSGR